MAMMKLYDFELSGNCYKVRLLCSLLGLKVDATTVDLLGGAHKRSPLIDLNPFGEVPILEDGDVVLRDSQAILVYLAGKHGGEDWLPTDAASLASVIEWLMVAENEIARGPADARLHAKFGYKLDIGLAREKAARILDLMEARLDANDWLVLYRPTIADVACMPYVALAKEGGLSLAPCPAVQAWIGRIKALPGFIPMPGL